MLGGGDREADETATVRRGLAGAMRLGFDFGFGDGFLSVSFSIVCEMKPGFWPLEVGLCMGVFEFYRSNN